MQYFKITEDQVFQVGCDFAGRVKVVVKSVKLSKVLSVRTREEMLSNNFSLSF